MWNPLKNQRNEDRPANYATAGQILMVPVEHIAPNPDQPRRDVSYNGLIELAQSIMENGILNPLSIAFVGGKPILIAGERRLRAAKMAGIAEVPCIEVQVAPEQRALLALVENLQRENMNCFETAEGISRLIKTYGLTQEEAAQRLGCAQSTVANRLRLLRLDPEERQAIIDAGLSERHARALLVLDEGQRRTALENMIEKKLTVAQSEKMIENLVQNKTTKKRNTPPVRDIRVFINTVNHALDAMKQAGLSASSKKNETMEYIEYVVRIQKDPGFIKKGQKEPLKQIG